MSQNIPFALRRGRDVLSKLTGFRKGSLQRHAYQTDHRLGAVQKLSGGENEQRVPAGVPQEAAAVFIIMRAFASGGLILAAACAKLKKIERWELKE